CPVDVEDNLIEFNTADDGIYVTSSDNIIRDNIITQNSLHGIELHYPSTNNQIQRNQIAPPASSPSINANSNDGIFVNGSNHNTIGGTQAGAGNLVSGNRNGGIRVDGTYNTVEGNLIGTDASGTAAVGNGGDGITVNAANNTIGGTTKEAANVISGNANGIT